MHLGHLVLVRRCLGDLREFPRGAWIIKEDGCPRAPKVL